MQGRSAEFYADKEDLKVLLQQFAELDNFLYISKLGVVNEKLFETKNPRKLFEKVDIDYGLTNFREQFLVFDNNAEIVERTLKMVDGSGFKKTLSQVFNFDTVELRLGGVSGSDKIVMSDICTMGDSVRSLEMHKVFKKLIMKMTVRIGRKGVPLRLMPSAAHKVKAGWDLVRYHPSSLPLKISTEDLEKL